MTVSWNLHNLFLAGYVLCFIFLNCIAYLISSFNNKKFNQKTMRLGFIISIICYCLFLPSLFITLSQPGIFRIFQPLLLLCGSILSSWNSIVLSIEMRRVSK